MLGTSSSPGAGEHLVQSSHGGAGDVIGAWAFLGTGCWPELAPQRGGKLVLGDDAVGLGADDSSVELGADDALVELEAIDGHIQVGSLEGVPWVVVVDEGTAAAAEALLVSYQAVEFDH